METSVALTMSRTVRIEPVAPGIFQYGDRRGIIVGVHANGAQNLTDSSHPVTAGEAIVIYRTGLGEVDHPVQAGTATPLTQLSRTTHPISVTIGGIAARVDFAGLTPGSTGLYQVNAIVPAAVTPGNQVPVVLQGPVLESAAVLISVR